ncbi:MAG: Holliday junction branch migration protein RuvA, partial [Elusimicrobia bacterium]|nr:Holliday junction branch migration protein RuvA [Elusimicrobiota bacterium]
QLINLSTYQLTQMISYLKGTLVERNKESLTLDVQGVGYEVFVTSNTLGQLQETGVPLELFISESTPMYGGGTNLYGFLTKEEKEIYLTLKSHVPGTGAKKALDYLDKAAKSLPDFRRALLEKDARILAGVFGFTKKTADKLIVALKDKVGRVPISGAQKFKLGEEMLPGDKSGKSYGQILNALTSLGYRLSEARLALESVSQDIGPREASMEEMVRLALKKF